MILKRLLQITGLIGFIFTNLHGMENIEELTKSQPCSHTTSFMGHVHNKDIHHLAHQHLTRPQKFLSFDGGGIRGLYSLYIIKAIEEKLENPITNYCNLFTGTSTGGLIALGYASGKTTDELINLYIDQGKNIFYRSYAHMIESGCGLINEKYDTGPLEKTFKQFLSETMTLKDLKKGDVIIPSTNITKNSGVFFNSLLAKLDDKYNEPLWKVARCTSAAPTYFEPMELYEDAMADGGLIANNPSLLSGIAVDGVFGHGVSNNFNVISIGTGNFNRGITYKAAKYMGVLKWAAPISGTIMDSSSEMYHMLSSIHYGPEKYVRLNGELAQDIPLDGVSSSELEALKKAAELYISTHQTEINKAVQLLRMGSL